MAKTYKKNTNKPSCKRRHRHRHNRTKKQAGGFRYGNLHSGDVLVSASAEPKSKTRSRTRSKSKKHHKRWF